MSLTEDLPDLGARPEGEEGQGDLRRERNCRRGYLLGNVTQQQGGESLGQRAWKGSYIWGVL